MGPMEMRRGGMGWEGKGRDERMADRKAEDKGQRSSLTLLIRKAWRTVCASSAGACPPGAHVQGHQRLLSSSVPLSVRLPPLSASRSWSNFTARSTDRLKIQSDGCSLPLLFRTISHPRFNFILLLLSSSSSQPALLSPMLFILPFRSVRGPGLVPSSSQLHFDPHPHPHHGLFPCELYTVAP